MSSVGYEFTYPELGLGELGFDKVISDRGLTAKYSSQGTSKSGLAAGVFEVSYNGMGYAKAAEQGKYILGKFYQYDPTTKEYVHGDWGYLDVKMYGYEYEEENDMIQDSDTKITLTLPHVQYVEFAVTDIAPTKYDAYTNTEEVLTTMTYQGDPLLFEAESGKIYNAKGNYVSAPYVESATPATTGRLKVGTTYPVTVTYDEKLVKTGSEVSFEVTSSGPTGAQYCKITDFKWDGDRTFTFNFTPSEMWADDSVYYDIQMTGVVGEGSEKVPNSIRYVASHGCVAFAYRSQGYDWNVFGKPSLLENVDFDTTDWTTSDSTKITDQLKNQLMLVTTKATETQADEMNTMIQQKLGTTVEKSESYNINLTLCKSQILNTGDGVRVSVGFPEGYSYDSIQNGVTFKAYHFKKNEQGEITGVEPIDCVVTQYGLVITCDSFSPFTIAAVEGNTDDVTEKTVIVSHTEGGTVSESVFKLSEGDSKTVNVQAEDGYQIESVKVGDQEQTIENPESMDLSISYDDITGESLIVDTQFIAETVLEKDEERDNASSEEHEHTVVTDPAEAPTCTKTGLTEGSHCSDCGEIIVAQEKVPATGHSYTYEDNGDNSHKATCSSGDLTVIQAHTYIDGVCRVCKAEVSKTYEVKWYIDGTESGTNTVKKGNIYSVKATDVEGKTFSHWSSDAEGSNKLSTSKTYTFYVSKNTTVYANYTTDKVEQQPIVSLSNTYAFTAGSKNYVRFESTRSIPSGYTVVEHGVIYGNSTSVFGKGKEDQLMRFTDESNKTLPAKVKKLVVSGTARNGMDYLNVSVGNSKNVTVYARGYIIVKNTTTNETTVMYSAVSSGSFNSLSE
jgi:hypothetical protein